MYLTTPLPNHRYTLFKVINVQVAKSPSTTPRGLTGNYTCNDALTIVMKTDIKKAIRSSKMGDVPDGARIRQLIRQTL
jgi:hypothetical protein